MADFAVVRVEDLDHVNTGDTAPDFTRPLINHEYWEDTSLSSVANAGPTVLMFHPMDGDFPAIYMWQEALERSWGEDGTVLGVSISSPYEHKQFIRERGIDDESYALFSDPHNEIAASYGIVHDLDGMAGITEPYPAVFVLAEDREIVFSWVATEWPDFPEYGDVSRVLAQL